MKKTGFTLAEILITLGIIGVVAAITMPSLITDTQGAQVGPKLAKAVASLEQANKLLLNDKGGDAFRDVYQSFDPYINDLANYLKITKSNEKSKYASAGGVMTESSSRYIGSEKNTVFSKDGVAYGFSDSTFAGENVDKINFYTSISQTEPPHLATTDVVILIDINGTDSPNIAGSDIFAFQMRQDGSLVPFIGTNHSGDLGTNSWKKYCMNGAIPKDGLSCTASIVEQGYKVKYKMK